MSYARKLTTRFVLPVLLAALAATTLRAEEEARVWTNTKGQTVSGILQEKGDDWAKILIKGRVHKLPLATLSAGDQEYIKNAKLDEDPVPDDPEPDDPKPDDPKPRPAEPADEPADEPGNEPGAVAGVVGLKVSEVDPTEDATPDRHFSASRLKLEVKGVPKAGVHCILIWMASFRGGGGVDAHSTAEDYFPKDGEYYIQEVFSNNAQSGASYKGYAVRLLNTKYEKMAEMTSESKYAKYLDDAQRKIFPGSLPEKPEK